MDSTGAAAYLRGRADDEGDTAGRRFGPKEADHWSVGHNCPACAQPILAGQYTTLVLLGPGADEERQAARDAGRWYNAVAIEVHWACGPYRTGGGSDE